jgi:hypothetical protein
MIPIEMPVQISRLRAEVKSFQMEIRSWANLAAPWGYALSLEQLHPR